MFSKGSTFLNYFHLVTGFKLGTSGDDCSYSNHCAKLLNENKMLNLSKMQIALAFFSVRWKKKKNLLTPLFRESFKLSFCIFFKENKRLDSCWLFYTPPSLFQLTCSHFEKNKLELSYYLYLKYIKRHETLLCRKRLANVWLLFVHILIKF